MAAEAGSGLIEVSPAAWPAASLAASSPLWHDQGRRNSGQPRRPTAKPVEERRGESREASGLLHGPSPAAHEMARTHTHAHLPTSSMPDLAPARAFPHARSPAASAAAAASCSVCAGR
eukprot:365697-Chlamydomonas_euryale.AAC.10